MEIFYCVTVVFVPIGGNFFVLRRSLARGAKGLTLWSVVIGQLVIRPLSVVADGVSWHEEIAPEGMKWK
jgi:hypothetical protein